MINVSSLNYDRVMADARAKKKGRRAVHHFTEAVRQEVEQLVSLSYSQKSDRLMNRLIVHLNVEVNNPVKKSLELQG